MKKFITNFANNIFVINDKSLISFIAFLISFIVSSCGVVSGIFKAGMDFGIFIVVALIVIIVFIVIRFNRNKNQ